jgi:uncharacterized protein (DUF924 family)
MSSAGEIVRFWRDAAKFWWVKDETFDGRCRAFEAEHHAAARRELAHWEMDAEGALALVLLLDQIPRNIYRGSPHAFATDGMAQAVAQRAVAQRFDAVTEGQLRVFFYLPYEHAETLELQEKAVRLVESLGDATFTRYAILHRDIIARFGRFPHRNVILGRASTAEELAFLADGGFAG